MESAQLISLPDIYARLKELIDDPDYTMAEVAILVGSDPGMAARFLRAVNNPLNRRACRIETVSHAVSLLGIRQVHDIVLGASVAEAFEGIQTEVMNMKKFWQRSFFCAVMGKQLARECGMVECDRLFINGLLHDIGHLFMYLAIPAESQNAMLDANELRRPVYQSERELLGFDYAKIGGHMMKQWELPASLQSITRLHTEPVRADQFAQETALLHLSATLVRSDLEAGVFGDGAFAVDPMVWKTTLLTKQSCLDVQQASKDQLEKAMNNLF